MNKRQQIIWLTLGLFIASVSAVDIEVSPLVKKSVKGISTLDRGNFFNVHSRGTDTEMTAFYEEYNVLLQGRQFWGPGAVGKQQTGSTGTYPANRTAKNKVQETYKSVATEHPGDIFQRNLNTTALANWVVEYYSNWENSVPLYYEPMNEPFVHADDYLSNGWNSNEMNAIQKEMAIAHRDIAKAVHNAPYLDNMKVIGFASAYPELEANDWGVWEGGWKMFIDEAGAEMDAYAIHLYDGVNVTGEGGRRVGANADAILDMIDAYTYIQTNDTKPFVIDEYGGIETGYTDAQFNIAVGQAVRSQMSMVFQFLDRPDRVEYSIPFTGDKSPWHINEANDYKPYGASLLIDKQYADTQIGRPVADVTEWVYTDRVFFFDIWKNVKGNRVNITTDNPDIFSLAYVDGEKLYIALNNADDATQTVNLSMLGNLPTLESVMVKSLQINANARAEFLEDTLTALPASVTIKYGQTLMYECTFDAPIVTDATLDHEYFYANKCFEDIDQGRKNSFKFDNIAVPTRGSAVLRLGLGREKSLDKFPTLTVNGTEVDIPTNWKGYDANNKAVFFGVIEVPVPIELLEASTTVKIVFDDDGGKITSLIFDVATMSGATANDELRSDNQILGVYPNPTEGQLTLVGVKTGSDVKIYSMNGILVHQVKYEGTFDLNVEQGIYLLEVNGQVKKLQVK